MEKKSGAINLLGLLLLSIDISGLCLCSSSSNQLLGCNGTTWFYGEAGKGAGWKQVDLPAK